MTLAIIYRGLLWSSFLFFKFNVKAEAEQYLAMNNRVSVFFLLQAKYQSLNLKSGWMPVFRLLFFC